MKITFHVFIFIIGFMGLFIGALPDLFPGKISFMLFGDNKKMDIAYHKLVAFANIPVGIRDNDIALSKKDIGYNAIYKLLHSFDPSMPSLQNLQSFSSGDITVDIEGMYSPSFEIILNHVVLIKDNKNDWKPICELRDLHFLIREAQLRYFYRLGLFFALFALAIEVITAIMKELKLRKT